MISRRQLWDARRKGIPTALGPAAFEAADRLDALQKESGIYGDLLEAARAMRPDRTLLLDMFATDKESVSVCLAPRIKDPSRPAPTGRSETLATWMSERAGRVPALWTIPLWDLGIDRTGERIRWFWIDGARGALEVEAALSHSLRCLVPEGIVWLEGVFDAQRPGAGEALAKFLLSGGALVPFLILEGDCLLCPPLALQLYRHLFWSDDAQHWAHDHGATLRSETFWGHDIALLSAPTTKSAWWKRFLPT